MNKPTKGLCRSCDRPSLARGLCGAHYTQLRRHGLIINDLKMYGERTKHPHYRRWITVKEFGIVPEWEDFTAFAEAIGDPPTSDCRLRKKEPGEPLGPKNFRWVRRRSKEERAEVQRVGRIRRYYGAKADGEPAWTDQMRNGYYMRKFGITLADYNRMLTEQRGVCAICLKADNRRLAVDHCHDTKKVRGLLCASCNISIGRMGHDPAQLRRAIDYIARSLT